MKKIKHPKDKMERRRSAEAKALEHFRQRRIDGKRRKKLVELQDQETKDELREGILDAVGYE